MSLSRDDMIALLDALQYATEDACNGDLVMPERVVSLRSGILTTLGIEET